MYAWQYFVITACYAFVIEAAVFCYNRRSTQFVTVSCSKLSFFLESCKKVLSYRLGICSFPPLNNDLSSINFRALKKIRLHYLNSYFNSMISSRKHFRSDISEEQEAIFDDNRLHYFWTLL